MAEETPVLSLGQKILDRNEELEAERLLWDQFFQDIANYVMPRKATITEHYLSPDTTQHDRLFDTTAARANLTLANGSMAMITPIEDMWFAWKPPRELSGNDKAEAWFSECTRIAHEDLIESNFYTEQHEALLDRGGFGTSCLIVQMDDEGLYFKAPEIGTYSIAENHKGQVDTFYRTIEMTASQMVKQWGEDKVSTKVLENYKRQTGQGKGGTEIFEVVHAIEPRLDRDYWRMDNQNMPWMDVYVEKKTKHVLEEGGHESMPALVSRYLLWDKRQGPYGWSPSWFALPEARQANLLVEYSDTVCELQAFPRMLIPDNMKDDVKMEPMGETYFDANDPNAKPEEWMTGGKLDAIEWGWNGGSRGQGGSRLLP